MYKIPPHARQCLTPSIFPFLHPKDKGEDIPPGTEPEILLGKNFLGLGTEEMLPAVRPEGADFLVNKTGPALKKTFDIPCADYILPCSPFSSVSHGYQ